MDNQRQLPQGPLRQQPRSMEGGRNTITTIQRPQYYPSGLPWAEGVGAGEQPYKHNGTEFIEMHEYDVSGHGRRGLHHTSGRYTTMDRFAENFPWQPPYVHAANNPVNYVDVNGDSINIQFLQLWDQTNETDLVNTLLSNLSEQTGLTYSVSSKGILTYAKDSNGKAIITTTKDADGNTIQSGSQTARDIMTNAIDHTDMITIAGGRRTGVITGTNQIGVNIKQIEDFVNGAANVDPKTMGWGMTLMHEIQHTQVGGGLLDSPFNPGPVVTNMNKIRAELNIQGKDYGQRLEYYSTVQGGVPVLPFNNQAQTAIKAGWSPILYHGSKFVKF